jgi:hypothetical protein
VDELAGRLFKKLPRDVEVLVISDHGNQAQRGVLAVNQLLAEWGFLRFRREPSRGEDVDAVVDWGRSLAVAWGGYYARVFINAVGEEAVDVKRELKRKLSVLKAPWGHIRNAVFEPAELYRAVRGDAPDLMVYFDSLRVRLFGFGACGDCVGGWGAGCSVLRRSYGWWFLEVLLLAALQIAKKLDAHTIITSDHGEALGPALLHGIPPTPNSQRYPSPPQPPPR